MLSSYLHASPQPHSPEPCGAVGPGAWDDRHACSCCRARRNQEGFHLGATTAAQDRRDDDELGAKSSIPHHKRSPWNFQLDFPTLLKFLKPPLTLQRFRVLVSARQIGSGEINSYDRPTVLYQVGIVFSTVHGMYCTVRTATTSEPGILYCAAGMYERLLARYNK